MTNKDKTGDENSDAKVWGEYNKSGLEMPQIFSPPLWSELRVFLAAAKAGSFSRAAEILNTSQPSVSRQVLHLEKKLGIALFVRYSTGVKLTDTGRKLAEQTARLDLSIHQLTEGFAADREEAKGLVRIVSTEALVAFWLVPFLPQLQQEFPDIAVDVSSLINMEDLRKNDADLMVSLGHRFAGEHEVEQLGTIHLVPFASKKYIKHFGRPTKSNIAKHKFLYNTVYDRNHPAFAPWFELADKGQRSHSSNMNLSYGFMVKSGLGIGLIGSFTNIDKDLVPLPELGAQVKLEFHLVSLK